MPKLAAAMTALKEVFDDHAGPDCKLDKVELGNLLRNEFGIQLSEAKGQMQEFFNNLDRDKDNSVDYEEFVTFAVAVSLMMQKK